GTATTDAELDINATVSGDPAIQFKIASSTEFRVGVDDTDGDAFKISEGGALGTNDRLIIDPAGNVYIPTGDIDTLDGGYRDAGSCVAGTCASDKNLKENITPISGALDVIRKLRPSTFNFTDEKFGPGLQFGLIAQEVEEVLPELVEENSKGYKTVKYGMELQMLTMAAVKDLDSKVAEIEQHIDTPKNTAERGSILQVSGGSITVTSGYHKIAPEEGEDDVLAIIHGGELDGTITLQGTDATRITLRKSGKLLLTKGDFTLNGPEDTIVLMKIAEDTWVELSRSNDGSGINDLLQSMQGAFTGVDR
ncbi:MAG: tail fiber domain-containing protein, partial [Candidatus Peregrinibacteria bacterium]|nr:tail fiber domain-containing protein [Candidatus Peregrinibacteria bacterium]